MLFNSYVFFIFITIFFIFYYSIPQNKKKYFLLIFSYTFYANWDFKFISLILLSTFIDYYIAKKIERSKKLKIKKYLLCSSIISNLTILTTFKYFNFFSESLIQLLNLVGIRAEGVFIEVFLPIGISFYTFQSMGYTIDVYKKRIKAEKDFAIFALFISFFPQLVAGPIEKASRLIPQLRNLAPPSRKQISEAFCLLIWGYFLKLVIADNLAMISNESFNPQLSPELRLGTSALLGICAFSIQVYCDFRSYSLIARGLAKLMGIELIRNFKQPYFSTSPIVFWQRWHISLSQWFKDYLYIPLGGNRSGKILNLRNIMITMVVGGLWHGASTIYLLWGFYHGLILVASRLIKYCFSHKQRPWMKTPLILVTNLFLLYAILIFRSRDIDQIVNMTKNIFLWNNNSLSFFSEQQFIQFFWLIVFASTVFSVDWWQELREDEYFLKFSTALDFGIGLFIVVMTYLLAASPNEFVYFQF